MSNPNHYAIRDAKPPDAHYWTESQAHVSFWTDAIRQQKERLSRVIGFDELSGRRLADALFLIVALFRLRRAVQLCLDDDVFGQVPDRASEIHRALREFDQAVPRLEHFRHGTEHFDSWLHGRGKTQPAATAGERYRFRSSAAYIESNGSVTYEFTLEGETIELMAAADAAHELAKTVSATFMADLPRRIRALRR
jgi:hypothetical protein